MPTIYRFPILYRLAMRVGYGPDYGPRYALVADLVADHIGPPGSVLELCCGDLELYHHLASRGLAGSYLGLEQAPAMLRRARRRGVDVRAFDVRAGGALPMAGAVIMQASLYQFHDIADALLPRPCGRPLGASSSSPSPCATCRGRGSARPAGSRGYSH